MYNLNLFHPTDEPCLPQLSVSMLDQLLSRGMSNRCPVGRRFQACGSRCIAGDDDHSEAHADRGSSTEVTRPASCASRARYSGTRYAGGFDCTVGYLNMWQPVA